MYVSYVQADERNLSPVHTLSCEYMIVTPLIVSQISGMILDMLREHSCLVQETNIPIIAKIMARTLFISAKVQIYAKPINIANVLFHPRITMNHDVCFWGLVIQKSDNYPLAGNFALRRERKRALSFILVGISVLK